MHTIERSRNLAARAGMWSAQHRKLAIWGWIGLVLVVFALGNAAKTDTQEQAESGVGESGRAGGGAQERLKQAIDLYRAGHARYLVFSSGFVYSFHEADAMRALAVDQGVPASVIVLEERSTNTFQNVQYVDEILRDHHWQKILLVSSPYHMRRALLVWRE